MRRHKATSRHAKSKSAKIILYDAKGLQSLSLPGEMAMRAVNYVKMFSDGGVESYVKNVRGEMYILTIDDKWALPVFVPSSLKNPAYVASLYSHYVRYGLDEVHELQSPILEFGSRVCIFLIGAVLKFVNIDNAVYINNWLLSTNLYPDMPAKYVRDVSVFVAKQFPGKFIIWSSINEKTTPVLFHEMQRNKFVALFRRSVWIQDIFTGLGSRIEAVLRRERKLMDMSPYKFSQEVDYTRMRQLYDLLYINKYSIYNPMFTERFLQKTHEQQLLTYFTLSRKSSSAAGVVGFITLDGILTTPILGYDNTIPQPIGLYRILSINLQDIAKNNNYVFHSSAGAGEFKRSRGSKNYIEYQMIFPGNVHRIRLWAVKLFGYLLRRIVVPIMQKRGL